MVHSEHESTCFVSRYTFQVSRYCTSRRNRNHILLLFLPVYLEPRWVWFLEEGDTKSRNTPRSTLKIRRKNLLSRLSHLSPSRAQWYPKLARQRRIQRLADMVLYCSVPHTILIFNISNLDFFTIFELLLQHRILIINCMSLLRDGLDIVACRLLLSRITDSL